MKAVDLGLPSGLKWADCNVGAEKETDYGLYFQFGDTVGYKDFSHSTWETCPGNEGQNNFNKSMMDKWDAENLCNGVLKTDADAAYVHMGGNWRMPTEEDFEELYKHTINLYAEINGVRGRKFVSKKDSSKYIFSHLQALPLKISLLSEGWGATGGAVLSFLMIILKELIVLQPLVAMLAVLVTIGAIHFLFVVFVNDE